MDHHAAQALAKEHSVLLASQNRNQVLLVGRFRFKSKSFLFGRPTDSGVRREESSPEVIRRGGVADGSHDDRAIPLDVERNFCSNRKDRWNRWRRRGRRRIGGKSQSLRQR